MWQATEDTYQLERGLAFLLHECCSWAEHMVYVALLPLATGLWTAIPIALRQFLCPRAAILSGLGLETVRVIMVTISNLPPLAWDTGRHGSPTDTHWLPQVAQVTAFSF